MPTVSFPIPDVTWLLRLVKGAQKKVPALKYASGLVGLAAASSVINIILGHTIISIIMIISTFVGMILLFLFSVLTTLGNSISIKIAANVIMWSIVVFFSSGLLLCLSALAARWPPGLAAILLPASELSNADLLEKVVARTDFAEAESAVTELAKRCENGCKDKVEIIEILKTVMRDTGHLGREINVPIVSALKKMTNNDIRSVVNDEFQSEELVGVDFSMTNLSGMNFEDSFMILSNFRNANLSRASLKNGDVRGVDFSGTQFDRTNMENSDWFNSFNLDKSQIDKFEGAVLTCPGNYRDPTFKSYIESINEKYGISFQNYDSAHQRRLMNQWKVYSAPGGACEFLDKPS